MNQWMQLRMGDSRPRLSGRTDGSWRARPERKEIARLILSPGLQSVAQRRKLLGEGRRAQRPAPLGESRDRLNRLAQFREGEPPGEPSSKAARTEPRPPRIAQAHLVGRGSVRTSRRAIHQGGSDRASPSQDRASPFSGAGVPARLRAFFLCATNSTSTFHHPRARRDGGAACLAPCFRRTVKSAARRCSVRSGRPGRSPRAGRAGLSDRPRSPGRARPPCAGFRWSSCQSSGRQIACLAAAWPP